MIWNEKNIFVIFVHNWFPVIQDSGAPVVDEAGSQSGRHSNVRYVRAQDRDKGYVVDVNA